MSVEESVKQEWVVMGMTTGGDGYEGVRQDSCEGEGRLHGGRHEARKTLHVL